MIKHLVFTLFALCAVPCTACADMTSFAENPAWLAVGHYQPAIFSDYKGTIGSDNFYLSPEGKRNPQEELQATIKLFQGDDTKKQCVFPARYKLLSKHNFIDKPFPKCDEYEQFKKDLQPSGVTLLFTDAFMNNSSSLFGHTLLRIDTARQGTQLLAHGINYGAWTEGYENSFLYAIYGLLGFYQGGYTTKPYYEIINTYNNLENRDIWEYNLNLSPEELDFLIAHIWEVGQTTTPYYFFTLNCSYMLTEVLDAVRPSLKLSEDFPLQTIPLDTIKAVNSRENLVANVNYRPSRQRKISHRIKQMNKAQYRAFIKVIHDKDFEDNSLSAEETADVLETAYQYTQYQYVAGDLPLTDYRKKSFKLLKARNQVKSKPIFDELKEGNNPANSHDSKQLSLGVGFRNGEAFQQVSVRPAYHSLIDNNFGFLSGAEINFLEAMLRHYDYNNKYLLHKLNILQLASLSPIDEVFRAVSYRIDLNITREFNPKTEDEYYALNGSVEGGGAYAANENIKMYALSGVDIAYGRALKHNAWAGVSLTGGVLANWQKIGLQAEAKKIFATNRIGSILRYKAEASYYLTKNLALSAEFNHTDHNGKDITETLIRLKKHF